MSRSYRHIPYGKDSQRSRVPHRYKGKTLANRAVRRKNCVPGHGGYRKAYESWDICDYKSLMTEKEWLEEWKNGKRPWRKNYKEARRQWIRWYKSK